MHTPTSFSIFPITPWAWPRLVTLRASLRAGWQRRHARAQARRAARAFEQLDDRTLRDLGFHRCDAGALSLELQGLCATTFARVQPF